MLSRQDTIISQQLTGVVSQQHDVAPQLMGGSLQRLLAGQPRKPHRGAPNGGPPHLCLQWG